MIPQLKTALVMLLALTILTGGIYPLVVTGVALAVFPHQANGSLIIRDGQAVGSELIGQPFDDPGYFWGRPSATGTFAYNAFNAQHLTTSSGSNYGPLNPALVDAAQARMDALKAVDPGNAAPIPVDLVTASGSGLDPHISVAAAAYQVPRVAREQRGSTKTTCDSWSSNTRRVASSGSWVSRPSTSSCSTWHSTGAPRS